jgi:hypothetical protein
MTRPTLPQPIVVCEWWKNRRGESIRMTLSTYENRNIVDVRTWHTDEGRLKPTKKGFCAEAQHLPQLAKAFVKAEQQARELRLIGIDDENGGAQ